MSLSLTPSHSHTYEIDEGYSIETDRVTTSQVSETDRLKKTKGMSPHICPSHSLTHPYPESPSG